MRIKNPETNELYDFSLDGLSSFACTNDSEIIFYSVIDSSLRPYKLCKASIKTGKKLSVYEENDTKFSLEVFETKTREFIFINTTSSTMSEVYFIPADKTEKKAKVFLERKKDVAYEVFAEHSEFFIRYKDKENLNGKVYYTRFRNYSDKSKWIEVKAHNKNVRIENFML